MQQIKNDRYDESRYTMDPLGIESTMHENGMSPLFGKCEYIIPGRPVSFSNERQRKSEYKVLVRGVIGGDRRWIYSHQVSAEIVMHLCEQSFFETNEVADIDNYVKMFFDCLKGNGGIVIDDCQFHAVNAYWIDVPSRDDEKTIIKLSASPDDFMLQPISLFELGDGQYYPFTKHKWSPEGIVELSEKHFDWSLDMADSAAKAKTQIRRIVRDLSLSQREAYQITAKFAEYISQYIDASAYIWGFNRARIEDAGFEKVARANWNTATDGEKAATVNRMIAEFFERINLPWPR